ncbi:hypothetical protein V7161_01090 [Neobacillus drentensis]
MRRGKQNENGLFNGNDSAYIINGPFPDKKNKQKSKKDKVVLIVFSVFGWLIANLLIFFPDVPGPSELIDVLYKPLGKLLE